MAKCIFCDVYVADLWNMGAHVRDAHPEHSFKCPRQDEISAFAYPEHSAFWRSDGTCSHCGSISPEMFFKAVEGGAPLGPTDKPYKVYVGDRTDRLYFQHFSNADRKRFVSLLNEGLVNFGNSGGFYVLPFFIVKE